MFLLITVWGTTPARGQAGPDSLPPAPLVTGVQVVGNTALPETVLLVNLRTRANRTFLGLPGLRLWVWLYNLGDRGCCLSRGVARAFKASGEPPAYLDEQLLAADVERLQLLYRQEGFRQAAVSARVDTLDPPGRVHVTFEVDQGPPTHVRALQYEGLEGLTEQHRARLLDASTLDLGPALPGRPWTFHPGAFRFSETGLREERRRLLAFLRDEGYPEITRDSVRAFVTPVAPDSFDVTLRVRPGRRLRFGDVHFAVSGSETAPPRADTLALSGAAPGQPPARATVQIENERRLRSRALTRALQFRPGQWFNQSRLVSTKQRLEGTGLFVFSDFLPQWDAVRPAPDGARLPYRIELRTRDRHQIRWEFFMLSRDAVLGDESGSEEIGVGLGMSYRNANLLGTGEIFQIRTSGSLAASIRGTNPFNTAQAEIETSVTVPYLLRPFRRLDRALGLYEARSRVALRLLSARREQLRLIIRGRGAFQTGLEMRHSPTLTSLVSLIDFNLSDPDTLAGFSDTFLRFVDDPVERERILEDYSRPQVNNALRYTLRASTTNLFRRDRGYIRELTFELGGNLPYLLDRLAFTPDVVEGSIPGIPLFRRADAEASRLIYRQYVRLLADWRRYRPVSPPHRLRLEGHRRLGPPDRPGAGRAVRPEVLQRRAVGRPGMGAAHARTRSRGPA